jgi:anthranilate phosphoribosyltransferase
VMVVHGLEGLDEISISGETLIGELKDGEVREFTIEPGRFNLQSAALSRIQVGDGAESRDMLLSALSGKPGPARDVVALNAGAAIYTAGLAATHESGVAKALEVIASGQARARLDQFVGFTQSLKGN